MKTLKSILAGLIILTASVATKAAVKKDQPSQNDVVNIYVNAITSGKANDLDKYLDGDLQFNVHQGDNVNTLNKDQVIDYLNNNSVATTPENTNVTVLSQDDSTAKMKVEFKYDGYTRTDVVTLNKALGWKITNVDSTSK